MYDAKPTIREKIMKDEYIRNQTPNGKVFLKVGDLKGTTKLPALTFREGPLVGIGDRLWQQDVYVRVYDLPANGTVNINKIGTRLMELLHKQKLELQQGVFVEARLVSTLGELEDPAFNLTFNQYQFRVLAL